ncbi:MAG: imidazole glycerol phosphate synthase subunit HisH [Chloroflexi bacterium]|nr:imidazole glycerol phosphate synthase subunit HisH [Chloroflexota bacterium]
MIAVVDYGAGNLRSVVKAIQHLGYEVRVTSSPQEMREAPALILPGVGAAADAMASLERLGLIPALKEAVAEGKPFLGVCLGLQLLFDSTEEGGGGPCLGILPGRVRRLPPGLKVPHMGWNQVRFAKNHPVFQGIPDGSNFYFVHSYYPEPDDPDIVVAKTDYGVTFASAIARDNLIATQFHPEKSGETGLLIYKNFLSGLRRD